MRTINVLKVMMSVGVLSWSALAAGCIGAADEGGEQADQGASALSNAPNCSQYVKFVTVKDLKVETPDGAIAPGETATVKATVVYAKEAKALEPYPSAWLGGDCESTVVSERWFSGRYGASPGQSLEATWQVTVKKDAEVGGTTTLTAMGGVGSEPRCAGVPVTKVEIPIAKH